MHDNHKSIQIFMEEINDTGNSKGWVQANLFTKSNAPYSSEQKEALFLHYA